MRTNGLVLGALLFACTTAHGQYTGSGAGCGHSCCYGPSAQCSPCNNGWQFDFGSGSGCRNGRCGSGRCGTGRCGSSYECGPECQAFKRLLGWAFYRPLCGKSSCHHKNCCRPPLYALFPCSPHVACPCDAGYHAPTYVGPAAGTPVPPTTNAPPKAEPAKPTEVPSVPTVPTTPSAAAPANAEPVVQTALFNKPAGASAAQPVPQGKRISTYDPSKIASTMPALNPNQFRKPVAPGESCPK